MKKLLIIPLLLLAGCTISPQELKKLSNTDLSIRYNHERFAYSKSPFKSENEHLIYEEMKRRVQASLLDVNSLDDYNNLLRVIYYDSLLNRWVKGFEDHPKFKAAQKIQAQQLRQTCQSRATNLSELPRQTCPTTNKDTKKSTIKERGGSPLPAEGQAHAPLKDKQQKLEEFQERDDTMKRFEQLKKSFGSGGGRWESSCTIWKWSAIYGSW